MYGVWYEIITSIFNYIKFYICKINITKRNKLHTRNFSKVKHYCDAKFSTLHVQKNSKGEK